MTRPGPRQRRALLGAAAAACALVVAGPAAAATITVTRGDDPPLADATGCSLRQAVQAANTDAPVGACPAGETTLDTIGLPDSVLLVTFGADDTNQAGDLDVLTGGPVRIVGTGAAPSTIFQTTGDRVLSVLGGELALERVTITGGAATGATVAGDGGGILVLAPGRLTVTRTTVSANSAARSGGIANGHRGPGGSGGVVLIRDSTISGNIATTTVTGAMGAAGIGNINATLSLVNSTVSGNTVVRSRGGGIYSEALSGAVATVDIASSTIVDNAGDGANLHNAGNGGVATMRLRSSIISAPRGFSNCGAAGGGGFTSAGFNLSDDLSCALNQATDRPDLDALLGPLTPVEGGTAVHVPASGSPAIDAGTRDTAGAGAGQLATDQRGLARPVDLGGVANAAGGDASDIGAVEVQQPPAQATPPVAAGGGLDTAFAPRLNVARSPRVSPRGIVLVKVTCPAAEQSPPCRGTVTLRTRARVTLGATRRIATLATARFALGAGRSATLRLRLTPSRSRLVATVPGARRAIVIVSARDDLGNGATLRRPVQLQVSRTAD